MKQTIKVVFGLGLIVILLIAVDFHELLGHLARVNWYAAAFAFFGYAVQFGISGWKWSWALRVLGVQVPVTYLTRIYCSSHFIGQFLPTAIGGDAYRAFRTRSICESRTRSISAIAIDRVAGLSMLMLLGGLAALALRRRFVIAETFLILLCAGGAIAIALALALYKGWLKSITARFARNHWFIALRQDFSQLRQADPWRWLAFLGISLLFQVIAILIVHVLFTGSGSNGSLATTAIIVAITGLAGVLPLSINGLGITEGSMMGTALALGLNPEIALLVGVLSRILVLPLTLLCGIAYLTERQPVEVPQAGAIHN